MSSIAVVCHHQRDLCDLPAGDNLLSALRRAGYPVAAPCGGNGRCGKCAVTLVEGGVRRTVLACQSAVPSSGEIWLDAPEGGEISAETTPAGDAVAPGREGCGAAVDLGTTSVVVRLFSLSDGTEMGTRRDWNAQATYGADVISRCQHVMSRPEGLAELSGVIRAQVFGMIDDLCAENGLTPNAVKEITLAGNTVMQHLFSSRSPASIAVAPYRPGTLFSDPLPYFAPERPELPIDLLPCVAGFFGGDLVAGLLSCGMAEQGAQCLLLDIGTNGEMALGSREGLRCCSVASGPAFEGAEISCGMASVNGAVKGVRWDGASPRYTVIGGGRPRGICGSGLVDLLAVLLDRGIVDETGRLLPPEEAPARYAPWLGEDENGNGIFYLTPDRTVRLTAGDVRKLQLAKAAVAAGIEVLLADAGLGAEALDRLYLAGGFGQSLSPISAARIGMIPAALTEKTVCLGNSSLAGAQRVLLNPALRAETRRIQALCSYLELSGSAAFADAYIEHMTFDEEEF
ncbi:MAG: DUF4445 domain-containing protein [Oscillospiraceae bacterium]|nr:DUF4445 domain-containing protein [Oscillospiraceae bacterium]